LAKSTRHPAFQDAFWFSWAGMPRASLSIRAMLRYEEDGQALARAMLEIARSLHGASGAQRYAINRSTTAADVI
jgi:hypothetical protein